MTTTLMILDGFGFNPEASGNAVAAASTPNIDMLTEKYPHTTLGASGMSVGLPDGQMGNSEVGHLNIGAGRIIYQELTRITREIETGSFMNNEALNKAADHVLEKQSDGAALHVMGLLSDGGVHSHIRHLFAIIDLAAEKGIENLMLHCFLDGRDVPPRCAAQYIEQLEAYLAEKKVGRIATIAGRYYAMDRDNRWERVEKAYRALTAREGEQAASALEALEAAYARDENDEFVLPSVINSAGGHSGAVQSGDSVIMFNFRPDRAREITRTFCDPDFSGFEIEKRPDDIVYVCMTQYDAAMPGVIVAFPPQTHVNTLGEYVASLGRKQLRLAETEKYAHVTFFFNGGVEEPNENEDRILIPSPKVATYDLKPEMSAEEVCEAAVNALNSREYDLIVMNFANPDMVGHTGVFDAAVKAVEAVDSCVGRIYEAVVNNEGSLFITADHGNADTMYDADGNTITAHSTNPVPAILVTPEYYGITKLRSGGILADIAPTLLKLMNLSQPAEMTGSSLI